MGRQEILKRIIATKTLERPLVKKRHLFALALMFAVSVEFISWLCLYSKLSILNKIVFALLFLVFFVEVYLRFLFIQLIKCYQRYAKDNIRRRCKCLPSCSEYTVIVLQKIFPLILALVKIKIRLFHTCREKYILDYPIKKEEKAYFERLINARK